MEHQTFKAYFISGVLMLAMIGKPNLKTQFSVFTTLPKPEPPKP